MQIQIISTMQRNVGEAIGAKPYNGARTHGLTDTSKEFGFQDQRITHEHCLCLVDGHLQVMRRKKVRELMGDRAETALRFNDAAARAIKETTDKIRKAVIDRKRAAENAKVKRQEVQAQIRVRARKLAESIGHGEEV